MCQKKKSTRLSRHFKSTSFLLWHDFQKSKKKKGGQSAEKARYRALSSKYYLAIFCFGQEKNRFINHSVLLIFSQCFDN
jgi:hypothetical protein